MSIKSLPIMRAATIITPQASVAEALQVMLANRVNHVPVCDGRRYLGLVGVNNILRKLLPVGMETPHGMPDLKFAGDAARLLTSHYRHLRSLKVTDVLEPMQVLEDSCPLLEAALLLSKSQTPLPVVDHDGNLIGMLSRRGLLEYLASEAGK